MSLLGQVRHRLRAVFRRARLEREMADEIGEHLARATERFRARGLSEADARRAARREFGSVAAVQEEARDARGARWIAGLGGDLRHAVRHYARTPALTATITLTLTLGIGLSAAAFSVVAGILARPAPGVPADPSLVAIRGIQSSDGSRHPRGLSYPELLEYARLPVFAEVAGWASAIVVAEVTGREPGTALAQFVTPNFFRTLGLALGPGVGFGQTGVAERAVPELTAVIGRRYAAELFGVPEAAVGRAIRLNGVTVTIVGVAPVRFIAALGGGMTQTLWLPVSAWPVIDRLNREAFENGSDSAFSAVARLRAGGSVREALPAVEVVAARAAAARPRAEGPPGGQPRVGADVVSLRGDVRVGPTSSGVTVGVVAVVVALILLVCTTTVSSLLVGAAMTRRHEIATRLALGASRRRIVGQLLAETGLLAVVAGAAGLGLFALIARGLRDAIVDVDVDPTWLTAVATTVVALGAAVLCGLSPALHATRSAVSGVLRDSAATGLIKARLQRALVVSQVALTQPLLIGLAMTIAIVSRAGDRGSQALGDRVALATFDTFSAASQREQRIPAVIERLATLPGVVAVIPQVTGYRVLGLEAPSSARARGMRLKARTHQVPPGYFAGMDNRLLRGREFVAADTLAATPPVVIASDLAEAVFGSADPIGRRLTTFGTDPSRPTGAVEIVGVVAATEVGASDQGAEVRVYTPMGGPLAIPLPGPDAVLVRTQGPAAAMVARIRAVAQAEAPMTPVREIRTLAEIDREARSEVVEAAGAAAAGGMVALVLAAIGLYAVVALAVSQRRREIGVRVALGARPRQVVALFFATGVRASLAGLLLGLPLSAAVLRIVASVAGVPPTNTVAVATAVALAVVTVAAVASWLPARRAAGVDPLAALRGLGEGG